MAIDGSRGVRSGTNPPSASSTSSGKEAKGQGKPPEEGGPKSAAQMLVFSPWKKLLTGMKKVGTIDYKVMAPHAAKDEKESQEPKLARSAPMTSPLESKTRDPQEKVSQIQSIHERSVVLEADAKPLHTVQAPGHLPWMRGGDSEPRSGGLDIEGIFQRLRQEGFLGFCAVVWYDPQRKRPASLRVSLLFNGFLFGVIVFLLYEILN